MTFRRFVRGKNDKDKLLPAPVGYLHRCLRIDWRFSRGGWQQRHLYSHNDFIRR